MVNHRYWNVSVSWQKGGVDIGRGNILILTFPNHHMSTSMLDYNRVYHNVVRGNYLANHQ